VATTFVLLEGKRAAAPAGRVRARDAAVAGAQK